MPAMTTRSILPDPVVPILPLARLPGPPDPHRIWNFVRNLSYTVNDYDDEPFRKVRDVDTPYDVYLSRLMGPPGVVIRLYPDGKPYQDEYVGPLLISRNQRTREFTEAYIPFSAILDLTKQSYGGHNTREARKAAFDADPWVEDYNRGSVICKGCRRWFQLHKGTDYSSYEWSRHRDGGNNQVGCHHISIWMDCIQS
jgi:hypothetical protein